MIRDDTRQTIKFVIWVVVLIIIAYIASVVIFFKAGTQSRDNNRQIAQIATQKTPIKSVQTYYHLDRGVSSYSLKGMNNKGKVYYFIYLPHSKKAYLYPAAKGKGESQIRTNFKQKHPNYTINQINLGWYKGNPVWEVTTKNNNGNYSYYLYEFKTGNEINAVDNL